MGNPRYPLRIRFADDEWASRVSDLARLISDRPVFSECSLESILCFLEPSIPRLVGMHLTSRITFDRDATGWAGYTDNLSINELGMGCDLALAAYEHFILGHGSPRKASTFLSTSKRRYVKRRVSRGYAADQDCLFLTLTHKKLSLSNFAV